MTVEEIKRDLPMPKLLEQYGIKIRRGNMCSCPFHGADKHPSMKVYKDGVKCFTCGFSGDVFGFYQEMEHCDFKTAFKALGGGYSNNENTRRMRHDAFARKKAERERREAEEKRFFLTLTEAMGMCDMADDACEIFSDDWAYLIQARDWLNYCYELKFIEGKEINEIDVYRKCREVRRRFLAIG